MTLSDQLAAFFGNDYTVTWGDNRNGDDPIWIFSGQTLTRNNVIFFRTYADSSDQTYTEQLTTTTGAWPFPYITPNGNTIDLLPGADPLNPASYADQNGNNAFITMAVYGYTKWTYDDSRHSFKGSFYPVNGAKPTAFNYIPGNTVFPGSGALDYGRLNIDEGALMLYYVGICTETGPHTSGVTAMAYAANAAVAAGLVNGLSGFATPQVAIYLYTQYLPQEALYVAAWNRAQSTGWGGFPAGLVVLACVAAAIYTGGASLAIFDSAAALPGAASVTDLTAAAEIFPVSASVTSADLAVTDIATLAPELAATPATVATQTIAFSADGATYLGADAGTQALAADVAAAQATADATASSLASMGSIPEVAPAAATVSTGFEGTGGLTASQYDAAMTAASPAVPASTLASSAASLLPTTPAAALSTIQTASTLVKTLPAVAALARAITSSPPVVPVTVAPRAIYSPMGTNPVSITGAQTMPPNIADVVLGANTAPADSGSVASSLTNFANIGPMLQQIALPIIGLVALSAILGRKKKS